MPSTRPFTTSAARGERELPPATPATLPQDESASVRELSAATSATKPQDGSTTVKDLKLAVEGPSASLRELTRYLAKDQQGEYQDVWSRAWQLYTSLQDGETSWQIQAQMVGLFAKSPRALDAGRVVQIFLDIPDGQSSPQLCWLAINAHLRLNDIGKAYQVGFGLSQSGQSFRSINTTLRFLLVHAVERGHWQVAFQLWEVFEGARAQGETKSTFKWGDETLTRLGKLPAVAKQVRRLLSSLQDFPGLFELDKQKTFVARVMRSVLVRGPLFDLEATRQALSWLKDRNVLSSELSDTMMLNALGAVKSTEGQVDRAFWLYDQAGVGIEHSTKVMRTLLKRATDVDNMEVVERLLNDWSLHHGVPMIRDTALFMKAFARHGDLEKTKRAFESYLGYTGGTFHKAGYVPNNTTEPFDPLKLLYPLLHVHAIRADPDAAQEQLTELRSRFGEQGFQPDITCYNILLHAYQRVDDLDGCLNVMSRILEEGLKSDAYTFGTLMAVAASRGDSDLVEQLEQAASELRIPIDQAMRDSHMLALINHERPAAAEQYTRKVTEECGPNDTTRMWNQLLTFHALRAAKEGLAKILRLAKEMQKYAVPFDALTHSAIMRGYIVQRRTAMAWRILRRIVHEKKLKATAFHFALVIDGFAEQHFYHAGMRVYADMLHHGIKPDFSARLALQKLQILATHGKVKHDAISDPELGDNKEILRFDAAEQILQESFKVDTEALTSKLPRLGEGRFGLDATLSAPLVDLMLRVYGRVQAFGTGEQLLNKYFESVEKDQSPHRHGTPLPFLHTLMRLSHFKKAREELQHYWDLAVSTATRLTGTTKPDGSKVTYRQPSARVSLASHLNVYMRSLYSQRKLGDVPAVVERLYNLGFDLDNSNWNTYVQLVATSGRALDAFMISEEHLIPPFRGWIQDKRARRVREVRKRSPGLEFQEPRDTYLHTGELRITYRTVVRLAKSVKDLREKASFDGEAAYTLEQLQKTSPRTYAAVLELPLPNYPIYNHQIATHMLGKTGHEKGTRREIPRTI